MADIFDEVQKPQTQPKQAAPGGPAGSAGDVFDEAAKQVYSPTNQDQGLRNLEANPGDKWYQQRVDVSPEAGPISRFAGNIIGNPSLEDLGTGMKQVVSCPSLLSVVRPASKAGASAGCDLRD